MSGVMQFEFRLFGACKGQTRLINGHPFVDGVCHLQQSSDNMGNAARVFRFYNAFARGTAEYDEALTLEEVKNGSNEVVQETPKRTNPPVPASVESNGGGSPESKADVIPGDGSTQETSPSSGSASRDGHGHAGLPKFPEDANYRAEEPSSQINTAVAIAIMKLDPEVDSHWVMTGVHKGKPKLQAVEDAYGKAGLTRQDIDAAMPRYTRDMALDAALTA